jgi:hypothetical protein
MYVAIVSIEMCLSLKGISKCVLVVGECNIAWMVDTVVEFSIGRVTDIVPPRNLSVLLGFLVWHRRRLSTGDHV